MISTKVTVTVEREDGSTATYVFPVAEELSVDARPVYADNLWPPQMVSCWYTFTLNACKDAEDINVHVTVTDPKGTS